MFLSDLFLGDLVLFVPGTVVEAADAFQGILKHIILGWVDDKLLASLANNILCLFFKGLQLVEFLEY